MARLMMPSALSSGEVDLAGTLLAWAGAECGKRAPNSKSMSKSSNRVEVIMVRTRRLLKARRTKREKKRASMTKTTETLLFNPIIESLVQLRLACGRWPDNSLAIFHIHQEIRCRLPHGSD